MFSRVLDRKWECVQSQKQSMRRAATFQDRECILYHWWDSFWIQKSLVPGWRCVEIAWIFRIIHMAEFSNMITLPAYTEYITIITSNMIITLPAYTEYITWYSLMYLLLLVADPPCQKAKRYEMDVDGVWSLSRERFLLRTRHVFADPSYRLR